jgi:hypothetical protein
VFGVWLPSFLPVSAFLVVNACLLGPQRRPTRPGAP